MPTQEPHLSLSDGLGHHGGVRESFLLGSIWAWHQKGVGDSFLLRLVGVGLGLGNPTPMTRRADGTNARSR
jgi:hypothetical protein